MRLTDCIAIGNKRGFRIWTTGTLVNCFSGWEDTGLWCNGGPVSATNCTFAGTRNTAVMTDDRATQPITLTDCIISVAGDSPKAKPTAGKVLLEKTVAAAPGNAELDPRFRAPNAQWDGVGDAMDSQAFPNKGYRSAKVQAAGGR